MEKIINESEYCRKYISASSLKEDLDNELDKKFPCHVIRDISIAQRFFDAAGITPETTTHDYTIPGAYDVETSASKVFWVHIVEHHITPAHDTYIITTEVETLNKQS